MFASVLTHQYPELCCYFAEREIEQRGNKTKGIYAELKRRLSCYNYANSTESLTQT